MKSSTNKSKHWQSYFILNSKNKALVVVFIVLLLRFLIVRMFCPHILSYNFITNSYFVYINDKVWPSHPTQYVIKISIFFKVYFWNKVSVSIRLEGFWIQKRFALVYVYETNYYHSLWFWKKIFSILRCPKKKLSY